MDLNVKSVFFLTQRLIKLQLRDLRIIFPCDQYRIDRRNPYNSSGGIFVCCIKGRS
jgi:hypothetical protein